MKRFVSKIFSYPNSPYLFSILLVALFLRFYKLSSMEFISDQGWFYWSAKKLLIDHQIPLVGITSSHTWLHQGAIWTYILSILLAVFRFNPITPAYVMAAFDAVTLILIYFLGRELFNRRVGLIASFLYATSPLIIKDERFPYHTDLIPFFTALFLLTTFKWIKTGNKKYFPIITFTIAMLYNFELATFTLIGTFVVIFIFGLVKRRSWAIQVFNRRTLILSLIGLFPMIPMVIYDIHHGFPQTLKFAVWVFYKIAVFFGYPAIHKEIAGETWRTFAVYNIDVIRHIVFLGSANVSLLLMGASYLTLIYLIWKNKKEENNLSYVLLFMFFTLPVAAFLAEKTNSGAYLLMFFPQIALILAVFFDKIGKNKYLAALSFICVIFIGLSNSYLLVKKNYEGTVSIQEKINISKQIISEANGQSYNIVGKGQGSQYESFVTPYEYLTWYLGDAPSKENAKLKFYVTEYPDRIKLEVNK